MRFCFRVQFMNLMMICLFCCCLCGPSLSNSLMYNCMWLLTAFTTALVVDSLFDSAGNDEPLRMTVLRLSYWSTLSSFVARSSSISLRLLTSVLRLIISLSFPLVIV